MNTLPLSTPHLSVTLGKVLIAAAWADGSIQDQEQECIEDLLYCLPDIAPKDFESFQILLAKRPNESTVTELIHTLINSIHTPKDADIIAYALSRIMHADGIVTIEEQSFLKNLKNLLHTPEVFFENLQTFLKKPLEKRLISVQKTLEDKHLIQYLEYKAEELAHYELASSLHEAGMLKLFLGSILLAKVVWADGSIDKKESEAIVTFLKKRWKIQGEQTKIMAKLLLDNRVLGLDTLRVSKEFYTCTGPEERLELLDYLFTIARADGTVARQELDSIIQIAAYLHISQQDFDRYFNLNT